MSGSKTKPKRQNVLMSGLLAGALLALSVFSGPVLAKSAEVVGSSDFLILVETTETEIRLSCNAACAWENLSFSDPVDSAPQAIDRAGMTSLPQSDEQMQAAPGAFAFTIARAGNRISLEGMQGTRWRQLSFSCPDTGCRQLIDQDGMVQPFLSR